MIRTIVCVLLLLMAGLSAVGAGDVWQELKIGQRDAEKAVLSSLADGSVSTNRVREIFRAASPTVRTALVEQVLVWTKAYVNSPRFAKDYAAFRADAEPKREERLSIDEELQRRRDERAAELEEARKNIAELPAEHRKAAEDGYRAAVESMKQLDTPELRRIERQALEGERKAEDEEYEEQRADWEEGYPENPMDLVKTRLEEFLETTEDVDFAAQTVRKSDKLRFADAEYESKPPEWKLAYRAGKEPTEKARAFAKAWLAELEK